ncbi:hypothetical protein [Flagellimonas onchidii]|uniref:hypothetical protein n=1 Tax=Flagellimonas onchidii TaxID=2562684 RepID=UPI0010A66F91|nr:hypothetical protein [Allomuricauda onchidii]
MKFKIESKPSPLRQLDNIKQLKTVLKPIKTDKDGKFLDTLLIQCDLLHKTIGKDFSSSDHDHIDIRCDVFFDIPLSSIAWVGNGSDYFLQESNKNSGEAIFRDKKELGEYLQGLERIPSIIMPIKLELSQKIGDAKSKFTYELIG